MFMYFDFAQKGQKSGCNK